jgi:hypothetical protein
MIKTLALLTTLAGAIALAPQAQASAPVLDGGVWASPTRVGHWHLVARPAGHVDEDEDGWNCFFDGNGHCGGTDWIKVRGLITKAQRHAMPRDLCIAYRSESGYAMCADGRVFKRR